MSYFPVHTVAEINLTNLLHNYRAIRDRVAPAKVMAVVKADAYGHGALPVAQSLAKEGCRHFAVARLSEAIELRQNRFDLPLLIFGSLFPDEMEIAVQNDCRVTLTSDVDLQNLLAIARRLKRSVRVHIKVDTGMGRVGLLWEQALDFVRRVAAQSELVIEGVYTHFATADLADKSFAYEQWQRFDGLRQAILSAGIKVGYFHAANSGAILDLPATYLDMVRPGISLYGNYPTLETSASLNLRPVMTLRSKVAALRRLPAGTSISYGRRYFTTHETTVAVLPIGYADGIARSFTNRGKVMIEGRFYPMVGTITMDQIMVDVGDAPVTLGQDVYFWGETPFGTIDTTAVAAQVGTIAYELCCAVTKRVPRRYIST